MNPALQATPLRVLVIVAITFAFPASADIDVNPGKLNLEIQLSSASADVVAYLGSHNVQAQPWSEPDLPVRLYELGEPDPIAMAPYQASMTQPSPLASQVVLPPVPPAGTTFLVEVDALYLDGGATYRVGSSNPATSAAIMCGPVQPLTVDAGGLDCTASECAALVKLNVSLVGDDDDLDALDSLIPAGCSVQASVEEFPWSGVFTVQATSALAVFGVATLRSGSGEVPILVRGNGSRVSLAVSCTATVKQDETGFIIISGSRQTPLSTTVSITPQCDEVINVDVPITVERNAGVLKGLFDISGRTETTARSMLWFGGLGSSMPMASVPAGSIPDPASPWIVEGAPATTPTTLLHVATAAVVDEGRSYLELPHRWGLNQGVAVSVNAATDLGSTFVALPQSLSGTVVLDDRRAGTGLELLSQQPFSTAVVRQTARTFISADGRPELLPGGKSGEGGLSRSILQGNYDPTTGKARLSYELLLAGLSDVNGPLDGRGAAPTPWLVNELFLFFEDPSNLTWQRLRTGIGVLLPRDTAAFPPVGDPEALPPIPELHMCFGNVSMTLRSDPTLITLSSPSLTSYNNGPFLTIPGDPYSLFKVNNTEGTGVPFTFADRGGEAVVSLRLPAGAQYRVYPSVQVSAADGSSSNSMWFGSVMLPPTGTLQCGSNIAPCATVTDEGIASSLTIGVDPPVPACHETGDLVFNVVIDSSDVVTSLTMEIDGQPPQTLCAPCPQVDGVTQPVPVTVDLPADGNYHEVALRAYSGICEAGHDMSVLVPSQPLSLTCAPDFTCRVPAAHIPLESGHCCMEERLTTPQIVGGCGYPVAILDDRPEMFLEGSTDITFTAVPGEAVCTTSVTVQRLPDYQLAYGEGNRIKVREIGSGLYQLNQEAPPVTWLDFDAAGGQLAAALASPDPCLMVFDVDTGSLRYQGSARPVGRNVEFRPGHPSDLAMILGSPDAANPASLYWVALYRDGLQRGIGRVPTAPSMSEPEIAWNRDGRRLLAITSDPNPDEAGIPVAGYRIRLIDWHMASTGFENPTEVVHERSDGPPEEPFQAIYALAPEAGLFTSNRGISAVDSTNLLFVTDLANDHMDLEEDLGLVAFLVRVANGVQVSVIAAPATTPPVIDSGPVFPVSSVGNPRVELSEDGARIAVALDDTIEILEYPGFAHLATIDASGVRHMRFRPRDPLGDSCE